MTISQIYSLTISMVTALLGLAYPLFIDKISGIADKYMSRRLSERFRNEIVYIIFNPLLIACIIEMFISPFLISTIQNSTFEIVFLSVQALSVFILSMLMVMLYDLLMTYNDPVRLFELIRVAEDPVKRLEDMRDLALFAATDEQYRILYDRCLHEIFRQILEFQEQELARYVQN